MKCTQKLQVLTQECTHMVEQFTHNDSQLTSIDTRLVEWLLNSIFIRNDETIPDLCFGDQYLTWFSFNPFDLMKWEKRVEK